MGASYSTQKLNFQSIPVELLVKILLYLSLHDLMSCRCVNRTLNAIVGDTQSIQHQIDTAIAGVVDSPNTSLSLSERRDALACRQEAWDTFKPRYTTTSKTRPDIIQNGIYFKLYHHNLNFPNSVAYCSPPQLNQKLDEMWLYLNPIQRADEYKNIAFAACLEKNDLVAIGIRHGDIAAPTHTLEIDLLSFSLGGLRHSLARKPTLFVKEIVDFEWRMEIEIHDNLLAVFLQPYLFPLAARSGWPDRELWIFDWKTGQKISWLSGQGINAFRFLSSKSIVVADKILAALVLYTLPIPKDGAGQAMMTKVTVLELPSVDNGCRIARLHFLNLPLKDVVTRNNRHLDNAKIHDKPFANASHDDIIVVCATIDYVQGYDSILFVVHSSALLRHVTFNSNRHPQDTNSIPWHMWGPAVTRWYEDSINPKTTVCGQRCILRGLTTWEIWDFNPYRVRYLGKDFTSENETAYLSVETQPSCVKSKGLKAGIYSSLPYVKHVAKQWLTDGIVCLDDDRIFIEQYLNLHVPKVEHFYFG